MALPLTIHTAACQACGHPASLVPYAIDLPSAKRRDPLCLELELCPACAERIDLQALDDAAEGRPVIASVEDIADAIQDLSPEEAAALSAWLTSTWLPHLEQRQEPGEAKR